MSQHRTTRVPLITDPPPSNSTILLNMAILDIQMVYFDTRNTFQSSVLTLDPLESPKNDPLKATTDPL